MIKDLMLDIITQQEQKRYRMALIHVITDP